jgi:V/A-type H+-transporting ATPase subunit C
MMQNDSSKKLKNFFDVYLEKIDIYLIKNQIKKKIDGRKIEESILDEAILLATKDIVIKIMDAEITDLPTILKDYEYEQALIDALSEDPVDFLTIDTAIDKHVIRKLQQVKVPYKCEKPKQDFIKIMIDIRNIKNILRAKQLGYDIESCKKLFVGEGHEIASWKFEELTEVDSVSQVISGLEGTSYFEVLKESIEQYNKNSSVQILETALDGLFLKRMRDISMENYISIGPTIRFLVSKEFETLNLKIIAKGVDEGLPPELIKNFLVMEVA